MAELETLLQKIKSWQETGKNNKIAFLETMRYNLIEEMFDSLSGMKNLKPVNNLVALQLGSSREEMEEAIQCMHAVIGKPKPVNIERVFSPFDFGIKIDLVTSVGGSRDYTELYSIFEHGNSIVVSYEPSVFQPARCSELWELETASAQVIKPEKKGRVCFVHTGRESFKYTSFQHSASTTHHHAKSGVHLRGILLKNFVDQGQMQVVNCVRKIMIKDQKNLVRKELFNVSCGPTRAGDVNSDERYLVVVEEATPPGGQRVVKLFQRGSRLPLDTYPPPTSPEPIHPPSTGGPASPVASDGTTAAHAVPSTSGNTITVDPSTSSVTADDPSSSHDTTAADDTIAADLSTSDETTAAVPSTSHCTAATVPSTSSNTATADDTTAAVPSTSRLSLDTFTPSSSDEPGNVQEQKQGETEIQIAFFW